MAYLREAAESRALAALLSVGVAEGLIVGMVGWVCGWWG